MTKTMSDDPVHITEEAFILSNRQKRNLRENAASSSGWLPAKDESGHGGWEEELYILRAWFDQPLRLLVVKPQVGHLVHTT